MENESKRKDAKTERPGLPETASAGLSSGKGRDEFNHLMFTYLASDGKINLDWCLRKRGLWFFLRDHFHHFVRIKELEKLHSNPPADFESRIQVLNRIVAKIPPRDCEELELWIVTEGFQRLIDRVHNPQDYDEKDNFSELREVFRDFIGLYRDRLILAIEKTIPSAAARTSESGAKAKVAAGAFSAIENSSWKKRSFLTRAEVAEILGKSLRQISTYLKQGKLKRTKLNQISTQSVIVLFDQEE